MTGSRTAVRPTGRALLVLALCLLLWVLGDAARLAPARQLAAALAAMLVLGLVCIVWCAVGLRARRHLVDDAVAAGSTARVMLALDDGALFGVAPLGRGIVREDLPAALGGQGDLPLGPRMPHLLHVGRRGVHPLGPFTLLVRDPLGMFHLRRTVEDGLQVVGLPAVAELDPAAERSVGILQGGRGRAAPATGPGELGPIPRPYASGDDMRRVHWRASARAGRLMTREDEPEIGRSAVVVLDTRRRPWLTAEVEDALVSHAATLLDSLGRHGWDVRVLDGSGDEITRTERRLGPTPLGGEADALARRASLLALAEVEFDDDAADVLRGERTTGQVALAIALGPEEAAEDAVPFSGLDLDRLAGRAARRTAILLRPEPAGREVLAWSFGAWTVVQGPASRSLSELLAAIPGTRP